MNLLDSVDVNLRRVGNEFRTRFIRRNSCGKGMSMPEFTHKQGQYLAYIHLYCKLHRRSPSELDMQKYFRVSPPTVHQMIVRLEQLGLITRVLGVARSIRVAIPFEQIPDLEDGEA